MSPVREKLKTGEGLSLWLLAGVALCAAITSVVVISYSGRASPSLIISVIAAALIIAVLVFAVSLLFRRRLKRAEEVLRQLRADFEESVQERTRLLAAANLSMRRELDRREAAEKSGVQEGGEKPADTGPGQTSSREPAQGIPKDLVATIEELRESERRWKTLVDEVRLLVIELDRYGRILYVNPFFLEATGYKDIGAVGLDWFETFIPTGYHQKGRAFIQDVVDKGLRGHHEEPVLTRSGETRAISWFSVPAYDETGNRNGVLCIGQDVTERVRAETSIRDSEEKFRSITESAYDGIILTDDTGKILYWNKSARKIFGYENTEVIGRSVEMLLPERYKSAVLSAGRQLFSSGGPDLSGRAMELYGVRKGGREVPLESSFAVWSVRNKRFFACILRDATERKIAEANLRFQARILSEVQDAVIVTDSEGRVSYWNRGAEQLYGQRLVDALGRKLEESVSTQWVSPEEEKKFRDNLAEKGFWQGEIAQQDRRGKILFADCSVSVLRDPGGRPAGHLTVARGVTERRNLEALALQAQKMAAMGQMAAGVAHELQTPLGVIYGYADVLAAVVPKNTETLEKIDLIKRQVIRCSNLINNLLDFARKHHMVLTEEFELGTVAASALTILRPYALQKAVVLVDKSASEPIRIRGTGEIFEQVLVNLAMNGIDATPTGGRVVISTQKVRTPDGFSARIGISDTGEGIPAEIRETLFEAFVTTKDPAKSAGLGLWLVKEIVTAMGGNIDCQSQLRHGTTFSITLPLAPAIPVQAAAEQPAVSPPIPVQEGELMKTLKKTGTGKEKIVVVDDEPEFLELTKLWLGNKYEVECFRSGVGLRHQLAAIEPDLLILDVHMPDKDGFSVCRELRADQRFSLLPILFITASKEDVDFMKTIEAGGSSYVNKPIGGRELTFRIQEMLAA